MPGESAWSVGQYTRSAPPCRLLPPNNLQTVGHTNILDVAAQAANFGIPLSAFKAASYQSTCCSPGQYTVFAPTDDAFRLLPPAHSTRVKDPVTLRPFLRNHIMAGALAKRHPAGSAQAARRSAGG